MACAKTNFEFPVMVKFPVSWLRFSAGSSFMIASKEGRQLGHQRPILGGGSGLQLFFQTGHIDIYFNVPIALSDLGWQAGRLARIR
jgi:hypothetical protein